MALEVRKGGFTFQVEKIFAHRGYEIPQAELVEIADDVNMTLLLKCALADEWIRRQNAKKTAE